MIISQLLNFILPNQCLSCYQLIANDDLWCSKCSVLALPHVLEYHCDICGISLLSSETKNTCIACFNKRPYYDSLYACYFYNHISKHPILSLKHGDHIYIASKIAHYMHRMLARYIEKADVILPIPLHNNKLKKRKFNQSQMIAQHLVKYFPNIVLYDDILTRSRDTVSQGHLSASNRKNNVKDAFIITNDGENLNNRHIILLDDVVTSGATVNQCSQVLRKRYNNITITIICFLRTDYRF